MAKKVTIYSTPTCVYCKMAKEFFKQNSIAYEEHDVASDMKAQEEMINKSEIIKEASKVSKEVVSIGCTIKARCGDLENQYTIVGSNEADPAKGLISNESPIARAFLGRKKGEKVTVKIPRGDMECEILDII